MEVMCGKPTGQGCQCKTPMECKHKIGEVKPMENVALNYETKEIEVKEANE